MAKDNDDATVVIRNAAAKDIEHITKLGRHVFAATFGHSMPSYDMDAYLDEHYTVDSVMHDHLDPAKQMIVACDGLTGEVMGFATLTQGTTEPCLAGYEGVVELQRIYVDFGHQGKGIAKLLAAEIEVIAVRLGFQHLWLGVWEENFKAQKVYRKLGYTVVGDHDFVMGDTVQTDLIMVKELGLSVDGER